MVLYIDQVTTTLYPVIEDMDTKHGNIIRWDNMKNILKKLSETIETLDANLPRPSFENCEIQLSMLVFCKKLHSAFM